MPQNIDLRLFEKIRINVLNDGWCCSVFPVLLYVGWNFYKDT